LEEIKQEIYGKIYDFVAENLEAAGQVPEYRKSTFLCDVGSDPDEVDVRKYLELPNDSFMEAVYVGALKRLPDERTTAFWKQREAEARETFQREVLQSIAGSSVVAINHISLTNNPYFEQKKGLRYHMLGLLYGLTDKSSLREFGKKLPEPVQKIIRRVFL